MNQVLSGGFSSRLMADLRTKRGLAYAVGGGLGAGWDHPGMFWLTIATKSVSTVDAIEGLREDLAKFKADPPSQEELKFAKDAILNSFIFRFDTPEKVLHERMMYEFYGFPLDYLEKFRAEIEKVTVADVNRVVQKYVHPEQFAVLIVGNASQFGKPLTALGPVRKIDISTTAAAAGPAMVPGDPRSRRRYECMAGCFSAAPWEPGRLAGDCEERCARSCSHMDTIRARASAVSRL